MVVYDAEAHACIIDGLRLHKGKRFVYGHNDMDSLRLQLKHATELAEEQNGGVLVITEGVFGMKGDLGKLDEIVALKKDFQFRLLVDDAHGFGTMGEGGRGTASHFGVVDGVDVLFNTFAKSMAGIGAFVSGPRWLINLLRYNMRSQLYAKSLPMPMVIGALKRLELIRNHPEYQQKLWKIVRALQSGLKENGFNIGVTNSPVTPVFMKGGIPEATNLIVDLRENHGVFCSIVVYPVIPKGEIILRVIPTAAHTLEDVNYTLEAFKSVRDKLESGYYASLPIPVRADEGIQGPLIRSRFRREPDSRINSRHLRPCGRGGVCFSRGIRGGCGAGSERVFRPGREICVFRRILFPDGSRTGEADGPVSRESGPDGRKDGVFRSDGIR